MKWTSPSITALWLACASPANAQNVIPGIANWEDFDPWPFPGDFVTSATFNPPPDLLVDAADLAFLLGEWGPNPGSAADMVTSATFAPPPDGVVDAADLAMLLGNWGPVDLGGTEYGVAWVFLGSPIDFESGSTELVPQREVLLDKLGIYDSETGERIGGNDGVLTGKYLVTNTNSLTDPEIIFPIQSSANDFRVDYTGDTNGLIRESIFWSSEASIYYHITNYRKKVLTDSFIDELGLGEQQRLNLMHRQFSAGTGSSYKPIVVAFERLTPGGILLHPDSNYMNVAHRHRAPTNPLPPLSMAWAHQAMTCDYAALASQWTLTGIGYFPSGLFFGESNDWSNNVLPAVSDGLSAWASYRYARALDPESWQQDPSEYAEVYKYFWYAVRDWEGLIGSASCNGASTPLKHILCDQGQSIDNAMMFNELDTSRDGVFPFQPPNGFLSFQGPIQADLAAPYIAAIFYDLANWVGLGDHKADLLFWKTISLIEDVGPHPYSGFYPMRKFGRDIQEAARQLWPDPNNPGASLYEDEIHDVLISRGIAVDAPLPGEPGAIAIGSANFTTSLPPHAGLTIRGVAFASAHPTLQPNVNQYNGHTWWTDEFIATTESVPYVAYRLYKHSKYGPCDRLEIQLPDGTYTDGIPNPDGTIVWTARGRELSNKIVFVPGNKIRTHADRFRCPHEGVNDDHNGDIGFYGEDVRPFGHRFTHADINGYSMTVTDHGWNDQGITKTFDLAVFDPSFDAKNPDARTYTWTITQASHAVLAHVGATFAGITLFADEPVTITIVRDSDGNARTTDDQLTVEFSESVTQLGREGGMGFVVNGLE